MRVDLALHTNVPKEDDEIDPALRGKWFALRQRGRWDRIHFTKVVTQEKEDVRS